MADGQAHADGDRGEGEDERICRFCLSGPADGDDDGGELIAPCQCSGGQKWVHLSCLRRWQRMVLVSQPTHPAFWTTDERQHRCNVCRTNFTCAPPTRHELMASFTGPELGALIEEGCVIGASAAFSNDLERRLGQMPAAMRGMSSYEHWLRGAYLITGVETDDGTVNLRLQDEEDLDTLRERLSDTLEISLRGMRFRLAPGGALADVAEDGLKDALAQLTPPCTVCLASGAAAGDCGDDHVTAVNLTRPCASPSVGDGPSEAAASNAVRRAVDAACARWPAVARQVFEDVHVAHYAGGPCDPDELVSCVVPGGPRGWSVVKSLAQALELAARRARVRSENDSPIVGGAAVRLHSLTSSTNLNGEVGIAIAFDAAAGRWLVRLADGEGKRVRPANLTALAKLDDHAAEAAEAAAGQPGAAAEAASSRGGRVLAFWGDARWSRTQLLGEIARGSWGMCQGTVLDLASVPRLRRSGLDNRLIFAPPSEMTEEGLRDNMRQIRAGITAGGGVEAVTGTASGALDAEDDTAAELPGEEVETAPVT